MTTRRSVVLGAAAALACPAFVRAAALEAGANPFTLGVASGDPLPTGVVLWTRLAPAPLDPAGAGGMSGAVPVRWEVADDEGFRRIAARGEAQATGAFAHSVHVEVEGLQPNRPYFYRFSAMGQSSAVGRTRTAPSPGQRVDRLRFAFASCSHWEQGYFSAYRHMAAEQPDVVLFLGDYIYEYTSRSDRADRLVRRHDGPEARDLPGYRNRYALYRTDPDLQALHAAAPCLMTWDDHEVENDYADRWSEHPQTDPAEFLRRRAAAYQAFYEHMPLRARSLPRGPDMVVFDRLRFGDLVEFSVLDGRQYRSMGACPLPRYRGGHLVPATCTERDDPGRTMLGFEQERWLADGLRRSNARWNVVAQDVLVASLVQTDKNGATGHWTDGWDGYPASRRRVLEGVRDSRAQNPVFLGGDSHSYWATDLKVDFENAASPVVATEFVGGSVTSNAPPYQRFASALPANPHVRYFESRAHGYVSVDVTPGRMETRFQAISDRRDPAATVRTLQRFVVEDGKAGAVLA